MRSISSLNRGLFLVPAVGAAVLAAAGSAQQRPLARGPLVDVVVALDQPSLARASVAQPRQFAAGPRRRLSLRAPASRRPLLRRSGRREHGSADRRNEEETPVQAGNATRSASAADRG